MMIILVLYWQVHPLLNLTMEANVSFGIHEMMQIANISFFTGEMIASLVREHHPGIKELNDSVLKEELISNVTEKILELKKLLEPLETSAETPMMTSNTNGGVRAQLIYISVLYTGTSC